MAFGNFILGPLDRLFSPCKAIVMVGNIVVVLIVELLVLFVNLSKFLLKVLLAMVGFCKAKYEVVIAHAKNFLRNV